MAATMKIVCPHCGAVNQDVTEKDRCWQCEKPLGSKPKSTATSEVPSEDGTVQMQVEKGADKPTLEERVAQRKAERLAQRKPLPVATLLILLIVIAALVAVLLLLRR